MGLGIFDEEIAYFKECERQDLMRKYSVGSKLLCINDEKQSILKCGEIYTVLKLDRNRVYIKENRRFSFLLTRFQVLK